MQTQEEIINEWDAFFEGIIKSPVYLGAFRVFVRTLVSKELPIIFETRHLAFYFGVSEEALNSMVNGTESFYREFRIPKRKGGTRKISTPWPSLLKIQRWILENILSKVNFPEVAHGFISGRSILSNAKTHLGNKCLLKMDIEGFFPSISINRIVTIFKNLGYPPNVSFYLARLCCLQEKLPQGAATSPCLSNIVLKRTDSRLAGLAKSYDLAYSRYADDMTFSGSHIPVKFIDLVDDVVKYEGFRINEEKTKLIRGHKKKIVTGISVSGDNMKLPRKTIRSLKQELFYIKKLGLLNHLDKIKVNDPVYLERILGKFHFWKQIEPGNIFVKKAILDLKSIQKNFEVGASTDLNPPLKNNDG
jgi:RNA-directed DNA polymerase